MNTSSGGNISSSINNQNIPMSSPLNNMKEAWKCAVTTWTIDGGTMNRIIQLLKIEFSHKRRQARTHNSAEG
jgi:hypothetical protein